MKSEYQSPNSVGKRPTIPIDIDDPRLENGKAGQAKSRSGGEVEIVDSSGFSALRIYSINSNIANSTGLNNPTPDAAAGLAKSGSGGVTIADAPLQVTDLVGMYEGDNIKLTFTFDTTDLTNANFSSFVVQVYNPVTSTYIPLQSYSTETLSTTTSSQVLIINPSQLSYTGLSDLTVFTKAEIATFAAQYTLGYVESNTFAYTCDLPAPVITASHSVASYTVSITNFATIAAFASFYDIVIQEFISDGTLSQVQAQDAAGTSTWNQAGPGTTVSTETFLAADGSHRWLRAYAKSKSGGRSAYSTYIDITPDPINPSNLTAPNNFTSATTTWSGNDIAVAWTMPVSNAGTTVRVKLVPVIDGTVSTSLYGYFYIPIATGQTTATINAAQLLGIFGQYYSSFQAHINSLSIASVPSNTTIDIGTFTRSNPLASVVPTASILNVFDGFSVQFDLSKYSADYAEVYQYFINPSTMLSHMTILQDYMDATYKSGGALGDTTIKLQNWTAEGIAFDPTYCAGQSITGTNIPINTYVTAITQQGQDYTVTLSNPLTGQASGSYHMQALVYSGSTAANIFSNLYQTQYIVVVYYDNFGNRSLPSIPYSALPTSPSQSVIANAVQIGSGGSIYVGSSATTGSRIVLGPSINKGPDGTSTAYSGIFAFDYGSTAGTAASTAIITNPGAASYTFETTNAKIADWIIGTDRIQNSLGTSSNYVGMAATGTYAFWAGSTTSGGDANAKFSVTPGGAVVARNINIYGDGTNNTTLAIGSSNSASAPFRVDAQGNMTATSATITGGITINSASTFGSNINMDPAGIFSALGTLANGVTTATQTTGSSVQIRGGTYSTPGGLFAYDLNHNLTTWIAAKPIADKYTLQTKAALLGSAESTGWLVGDYTIQSGNGKITLNANTKSIKVLASDNDNYGVVLDASSSTGSGNAIQAGLISGPNFKVDHAGTLTATGATITGILKSASRTSSTDIAHDGYYFNSSDGSFIAGSGTSFIQYAGSTNPIQLVASNGRYDLNPYGGPSDDTATGYSSLSQISLSPTYGTSIMGIPVQHNIDMTDYGSGGHYLNISSMGRLPRQRMVVENPITGTLQLGMGIYYQNLATSTSTPGASSGYVGDLWVSY